MFKGPFFKINLRFAFLAALIYCVPVFFFIHHADYTQAWLLYLGNFLFMVIIAAFLFYVSRLKDVNTGTLSLIADGEKEVILGILIACVLSLLLLIILIPGLFGRGIPGRVLSNKPVNTIQDRTNGLDFMVLINTTICNFVTGSFASIMLPASLKRYRSRKRG